MAALKVDGNAAPHPPRLLDALVRRLRYLHYSLRTEEAYVHWVRAFVRWSSMRHPRSLDGAEVEAFLGCLPTSARWRPRRIARR